MKGTLCILSNQFIDVVSISVLSFVSRFVLCIVERESTEWQVASATNTTVRRFTWRRRAALAPFRPLRPRTTPCPRGRADGDGGLVRRRRVEFRVRGRLTAEPCFSRPANSRAEPSRVRWRSSLFLSPPSVSFSRRPPTGASGAYRTSRTSRPDPSSCRFTRLSDAFAYRRGVRPSRDEEASEWSVLRWIVDPGRGAWASTVRGIRMFPRRETSVRSAITADGRWPDSGTPPGE